MKNINFLVLSSNSEILKVILRVINNKNEHWNAEGVDNFEVILEKYQEKKHDVVLFDVGISQQQGQELTLDFQKINPNVKTIWHYGGGSGLLFNEIEVALNS